MMMIAAGGRKAPKKQSRLSSACAESSVLGIDEGAQGFHRPSPDCSDIKAESVHDAAHQTSLSEWTLALTRIVHDVNIGPQFRAGQVVAVLDRIIEGRQQDEQDHGVDELREAGQPTHLHWNSACKLQISLSWQEFYLLSSSCISSALLIVTHSILY